MREKILIVDDDPHLIQYVRNLLTELGYSSTFMTRGEFLFDLLKKQEINLILMDIYLPGSNGLDLIRQIKAHPEHQAIPIIALTADVTPELLAECFEAGVSDFIAKPILNLIFQVRVKAVLERQAYLRQIQRTQRQMQADLRMAIETQRAMLAMLGEFPFLKTAVRYLPQGEGVSGDLYEVSHVDETTFNLFLGDATGHGITAAFFAMMVRVALAGISGKTPPSHILRRLNLLLASCLPYDKFVAGLYLRIFHDGLLVFSNAGNPPFFVFPAGENDVVTLKKNGTPLGIISPRAVPHAEHHYVLYPGDRILLFTDGILEWSNSHDEELELEGLARIALQTQGPSLDQWLEDILTQTRAFAEGLPARDDLTLIALEYHTPAEWQRFETKTGIKP